MPPDAGLCLVPLLLVVIISCGFMSTGTGTTSRMTGFDSPTAP